MIINIGKYIEIAIDWIPKTLHLFSMESTILWATSSMGSNMDSIGYPSI